MALRTGLIVAVFAAGCGGTTQTTTGPTPTTGSPTTTRLFTGILSVNGSASYSFTTSQAGNATAMLASLTASNGRPLTTPVGLGVGLPSGTDCAVITSTTAAPTLTPQLTYPALPGTFCVRVYDTGTLTGDAAFAIRIVYYP